MLLALDFCSVYRGSDVYTEPIVEKPEGKEVEKVSKPPGHQQEQEEMEKKDPTEYKTQRILSDQEKTIKEITPTQSQEKKKIPVFQEGVASWYGPKFHGKRTANGEVYDMNKLTAAHNTLPFHSRVEVENIGSGDKIVVRINDRGPFKKSRIIDLSKKAARKIGIAELGTAPVRLRVLYTPGSTDNPFPLPRDETWDESPTGIPTSNPPDIQNDPAENGNTDAMEGGFFVQAGAFSSQKNAQRLLDEIGESIPEYKDIFEIRFFTGYYKVVTDAVFSKIAAEKIKSRLDELGINSIIKEE